MKQVFASVFLLLVPIAFASAQTLTRIVNTIITDILRPGVNLLLVAATLVFIWGVIEYVAQSDNEEARTTGRRHMIWGIVGLVIMFSAVALVGIFQNFWEEI